MGQCHDHLGYIGCEFSTEIPITQYCGSGRHHLKYNYVYYRRHYFNFCLDDHYHNYYVFSFSINKIKSRSLADEEVWLVLNILNYFSATRVYRAGGSYDKRDRHNY